MPLILLRAVTAASAYLSVLLFLARSRSLSLSLCVCVARCLSLYLPLCLCRSLYVCVCVCVCVSGGGGGGAFIFGAHGSPFGRGQQPAQMQICTANWLWDSVGPVRAVGSVHHQG